MGGTLSFTACSPELNLRSAPLVLTISSRLPAGIVQQSLVEDATSLKRPYRPLKVPLLKDSFLHLPRLPHA